MFILTMTLMEKMNNGVMFPHTVLTCFLPKLVVAVNIL